LSASSTIEARFSGGACSAVSSGTCEIFIKNSSGSTLATGVLNSDDSGSTGYPGVAYVTIASNGSSNFTSQIYSGVGWWVLGATPSSGNFSTWEGTTSIDFTQNQTLYVVVRGNGGDFTLSQYQIIVNP
jgi:hypothetical protein